MIIDEAANAAADREGQAMKDRLGRTPWRELAVRMFLAGAQWHERQQIEETKASWRALKPEPRAGRGGTR